MTHCRNLDRLINRGEGDGTRSGQPKKVKLDSWCACQGLDPPPKHARNSITRHTFPLSGGFYRPIMFMRPKNFKG